MPRGRPAKAKADDKPAEEKEALAEVDENTENAKLAPKRGRGRPPKDRTASHSDEKPAEEKEALAEVDENTEDAKPAPKRGRPPKDKTGSKSGGGAENVEHSEAGEEPAVKKAKKKPQTSNNVKKISIEFCKS